MPRQHPHGGRHNALIAAVSTAGLARLASTLVSVIAIPVVIRDLGETQFAIYALLTGLLALIPFADLGVGLSLVTNLADAEARGDRERSARLVSSAVVALCCGAVAVLAASSLAYATGLMPHIFGIPRGQAQLGATAALISLGSVALTLVASAGPRTLFALNQQHIANLWQLSAAPLTLICLAAVHASDGGLRLYVVASQYPPAIVSLIATLWVFKVKHNHLRPNARLASRREASNLLRLGLVFAFQGAAMAAGFQADLLILSHFGTLQSVAQYNVAARLTTLITLVSTTALVPLWPTLTAAIAARNGAWLRTVARRAFLATLIFCVVASASIVGFGPWVIHLYAGSAIQAPRGLLFALVAWCSIQSLQAPFAVLLNAAGVRWFQVWTTGAMGICNVALSIIGTRTIGVAGPALGSAVAVFVFLLVPYMIYGQRLVAHVDTQSPLGQRAAAGMVRTAT